MYISCISLVLIFRPGMKTDCLNRPGNLRVYISGFLSYYFVAMHTDSPVLLHEVQITIG